VRLQFPICPPEIKLTSLPSWSLAIGYWALMNLPYPVSPAILEAARQVIRKAVRKIAPQAIR